MADSRALTGPMDGQLNYWVWCAARGFMMRRWLDGRLTFADGSGVVHDPACPGRHHRLLLGEHQLTEGRDE